LPQPKRDHGRLSLFLWGNGDNEAKQIDQELSEVGFRQVAHGRGRLFYLTTYDELKEIRGSSEDSQNPPTVSCTSLISQPVYHVTSQSRWGAPDYYAAITSNGQLYTWGDGSHGQLGHGNTQSLVESVPQRVQALADENVAQIACGGYHAVARTHQGALWSWGYNGNGRTGHGLTEGDVLIPKLVTELKNTIVTQVSAGLFHTALATNQGQLYTCGFGGDGRLGHNHEQNCLIPTLVESMQDFVVQQVSCGAHHTALLTDKGTLYTFGKNENGLLGHDDEENRLVPTLVEALETINITQVSCGNEHSVALSDQGQIYTWGRGAFGELGHGSFDKLLVPQKVSQLQDFCVVRVEAFERYTAALVDPISFGPGDSVPTASVLYSMVNNEQFADVTFLIADDTTNTTTTTSSVYAHRAILSQRCEFFATMFSSGMKESSMKEIAIHDIRREVFLVLLEYLYTDAIHIQVEHSIELYCAADMYGLKRLKNLCLRPLKHNMTIDNAAPLLQQAADSNYPELKEICLDFMVKHFAKVSKSPSIEQITQPELLVEVMRGVADRMS